MNRPNLFIVGAPKSGTTSLYYYLNQHISVFLPEIKEQHFFSRLEVKQTYYDVYFADTLQKYLDNFKDSKQEKIIADISPSYLYNKNVAQRIKNFNPQAKIITILREPVERAISHYLMDLRAGYVNKPLIYYLKNKDLPNYKEYIGNSLYYENIKIYKDIFQKDLLVLSFNDLKDNPKKIMKDIFEFLAIEHIELDLSKKYNTYTTTPSSLLYYLRKFKIYNPLISILPKYIKSKLKGLIENNSIRKPEYKNEKNILNKIFENENKKLEQLLDKKFW